ncbi:MAG: hypothetical protein NTY36_16080 [Deltaproteobacteria bacterium]|nr:hypothetical protein [Deltaproteobacteria bacterium]
METLRYPIAGDNNLAKINEIISFQEDHDYEFLDSKIAYEEGEAVNLVTFKHYDEPTDVKELILIEKGQEVPDNAKKPSFWEGVMVTGGKLAVVEAYRAK